MDLYSDNSVDLMEGFSLAGALVDPGPPPAAPPAAPAMDDFGPPPAAPTGFGYVVPSLGMAPMRMPIPPLVIVTSGMVLLPNIPRSMSVLPCLAAHDPISRAPGCLG